MSGSVENREIASSFPEIYRGVFPAFMETPIPDEVHATCDDCAMCSKSENVDPGQAFFSAQTKCCTYFPSLPNYLVGGLLRDDDSALEEGRRRVRARIDQRIGIAPRGVLAPRKYDLLYRSSQNSFFGASTSMICPYYEQDSGGCTVWRFREAVCSTFFCKYVKGADGRSFWQAVKTYVTTVEQSLVNYTLLQLGFDADAILRADPQKLTKAELEEVTDLTPEYRKLWGSWLGREEELYCTCAEIVEGLSREDFGRIGGVEADIKLKRVKTRHAKASNPRLPPLLQRNPGLRVTRGPTDEYMVVSFSGNQPSRMASQVYECLEYFDGRRMVDDVVEQLKAERDVTLSVELLTKLYQFRILVSPGQ